MLTRSYTQKRDGSCKLRPKEGIIKLLGPCSGNGTEQSDPKSRYLLVMKLPRLRRRSTQNWDGTMIGQEAQNRGYY